MTWLERKIRSIRRRPEEKPVEQPEAPDPQVVAREKLEDSGALGLLEEKKTRFQINGDEKASITHIPGQKSHTVVFNWDGRVVEPGEVPQVPEESAMRFRGIQIKATNTDYIGVSMYQPRPSDGKVFWMQVDQYLTRHSDENPFDKPVEELGVAERISFAEEKSVHGIPFELITAASQQEQKIAQ